MRVQGISRSRKLALVAGLAVAMVGTDAMAGSYGSWGSSGSYGSSCSSASYGSYGSSASYGSSGSSGSYGSHGRMGLFARMRARRAARRSSYGSSGSSASYGSSGSSASYGSYGSSGSSASYGSVVYSEPVVVTSTTGEASINVAMPEDAKVYVNDKLTTSKGAERKFVSRGLREGMTYSYTVRVEYEKDGKPVTENEEVKLGAGESVSLTFPRAKADALAESPDEEPVRTEVKVTVPEDASVFLSGAPTKQTGELRTYSTTQLAAGQAWDNYTVRVELNRNGQTLVREKKLTVVGGSSQELAFDFDSTATAQLAQLDK